MFLTLAFGSLTFFWGQVVGKAWMTSPRCVLAAVRYGRAKRFYLGTHETSWLGRLTVPCSSATAASPAQALPVARVRLGAGLRRLHRALDARPLGHDA
jgi:hypothetical protein